MDGEPVLIAGAGPVGVVTALALAQRGIHVRVFDAAERINDAPRASTLHPATLEMLSALGLLKDVIVRGLVAPTFQFWDRPTKRLVAEFDHGILKDDTTCPFVVQCEQHKLAELCVERLKALRHSEVNFSAPVVSIAESSDGVEAMIGSSAGNRLVQGRYLIGADGGRSTIRKALDIDFEGYTFPERFLVLTTPFDFAQAHGVAFRAYFSDPDEWAALFKVAGNDGRGSWRAVFPTLPGQSDEEVMNEAATEARLQKFFPGSGRYEIFHRNIYNVHQRVAARFQKGRVFLAGDSAHVNNPLGGLGLNCGIHDAVRLASLLSSVLLGERPESDLSQYDSIRRPMNIEYVQQQTNFETLRKTSKNPAAHRAFLMRTSLLESVRKQTDL